MKFLNKSTALLPVIILSGLISFHAASAKTSSNADNSLYSWTENPSAEAQRVEQAEERLKAAIANPEYMLKNWIELPTSPESKKKTRHQLTIREAILLALRYNPNIQNAELDRIIQLSIAFG